MASTRPLCVVCLAAILLAGCVTGPNFIQSRSRQVIDRALVDYPGGMALEVVVDRLTAPQDCELDEQGNLIVATSGAGGHDPTIIGYRPDNTSFTIYPPPRTVRVPFDLVLTGFRVYGPIGGIALANGKVYVTHRDSHGLGIVTAFNYDGTHSSVAANLPCQGDNGMSDVTVGPTGRLWFGVGSATNSGVVGLDNWSWIKKYPSFSDRSFVDLKLNGYHFKSKNPDNGIFSGPDIAVTAPYQPFNVSVQTRIRHSDLPTGSIYSADPSGGGLRVEAHGVHAPHGLAFAEYPTLYMTNGGMELRGTRPIKDDPDALLKVVPGTWYGFPDYSTDLQPITEKQFQPPPEMAIKSGYDEVSFLIDHNVSNNGQGLLQPLRSTLLQSTFPSLAGAANFDFVPGDGPLKEFRGHAIVPLSGDRAPFATSGRKLVDRSGFKIVRVDMVSREVVDLIRNTKRKPASMLPEGEGLLERPIAVKFAPDGSLYIVDFGRCDVKDGRVKVKPNTGKVLHLRPLKSPTPSTTRPATAPALAPVPAPAE
jgi:hypothetical protein